jgi:import inner membrane translocase subunit TIM22
VYSVIECEIEGARGKHDLTNSVAAGCATGAVLAYKSGPVGMCLGCAGFAAFSVVIDKLMVTEV